MAGIENTENENIDLIVKSWIKKDFEAYAFMSFNVGNNIAKKIVNCKSACLSGQINTL